jgi:glyoxylase I family protein
VVCRRPGLSLPRLVRHTEQFDRRILGHQSGFAVALTRHHSDAGGGFNERATGLDHLAFGLGSLQELEAWVERLNELGIDNNGVQTTPEMGYNLVAFRDPDGIQLELYFQSPPQQR